MAVRLKLDDGRELVVQATLDQWDSVFRRALDENAVLEIELPDRSIIPVDPRSIQSFREDSGTEAKLEDQDREATAAR